MLKRRTGAALGLSAILIGSAVTAAAADTVRVDGGHFDRAGLKGVTQGCSDPQGHPDKTPRFIVRRGPGHPPIGDHSVGWRMKGSTTFGSGIRVRVASPSTLDNFGIDVTGPAGSLRGAAVATYYAPNDNGVWKGTADLGADTTSGWHTVDATGATYAWSHYVNGRYEATAPSSTLQNFVSGHGGDGDGASIGIIYGCDGNPFYVDAFKVGENGASRTFDLDGYATSAKLSVGKRSPKSVTITAGQAVKLGAKLLAKVERDRITGALSFQRSAPGSGSWTTYARDKSTPSSLATSAPHPTRATALRVVYGGAGPYLASSSRTLLVQVRFGVSAHFADNVVRKGSRISMSGKVRPGRRTTVKLQHFVNHQWRTVKTGVTGARGAYTLATGAPSPGQSYYRVLAGAAPGNVSGHSSNYLLTVYTPSTGGGGGGGGGGNPGPPDPPGPEG